MFSLDDVRKVLQEPDLMRGLIVAEDLGTHDVPTVDLDDTVQRALDLLMLKGVDELPVVTDEGKLVGIVSRGDIMSAYQKRIGELQPSARP